MADDSQEVADIIDGLGDSPAPLEVYNATRDYDTRYLASAGAAAAAAGGGGGSQPVWEEVTVPTDEASWSAIDPAGNWDFTDGVITFTNEGAGDVPVIVTTVDNWGQAWTVEAEISVPDATEVFDGTFNAGAWLHNAESLQELDGVGFDYSNAGGGGTVVIANSLYANSQAIASFAAPDDAFHRIRVVNLPLVQLAYFDGVLVGQNNAAPQSFNIDPADGLKESRFLIWDGGHGTNAVSFRNLKAWRIPLPTFPA